MPAPIAAAAAGAGARGAAASAGASGAATGGRAAAGSAVPPSGTNARKVFEFDALFEPDKRKQLTDHANRKSDERAKRQEENLREEQEREKQRQRKAGDAKAEEAIQRFEKIMNGASNAVQNRFIPMIADSLPGPFGRLVVATHQLVDAFIERGKELAQYSGKLSEAEAITDVRTTMADIREAQELEDPVARMTLSANEIWLEIRDLLLPIKRVVAGMLANRLETIERALDVGLKPLLIMVEVLGTLVAEMDNLTHGRVGKIGDEIAKLPERIAKALKDDQDPGDELEAFARGMLDHDFGPRIIEQKPAGGGALGLPLIPTAL